MTTETHDTNARLRAARIVARWLETGDFPDRLIPAATAHRAAVTEAVYGTVRRCRTLEWVAARYTKKKSAPHVQALLLVGLYEVLYMDTAAEYATVNEFVEAARASGVEFACGFLNAVLRRVIRERDTLRAELQKEDLSIRESHPTALIERWQQNLGAEATEALCRWDNEPARVTIRPNRLHVSYEELLDGLSAVGIAVEPCPAAPGEFLCLPRGVSVGSLPGYKAGHFMVQDPATMHAVRLLDPQPGECILDACAAPGGKAALIAERLAGKGELVAEDMHADRLAILRQNVKRLQLPAVTTRIGDAMATAVDGAQFDRVLLDVPCTNTGVLRRRPDARWRFSVLRLDGLIRCQRDMLAAVSQRVKEGGTLVYSTCSLEPEENSAMISDSVAG